MIIGGLGYGSSTTGTLNDMWAWDISTLSWAFITGTSLSNQASVLPSTKGFGFGVRHSSFRPPPASLFQLCANGISK
jgi:hypothetical protein